MNITECTQRISETESELRGIAAKLIASDPGYDTDLVACLLKQSEVLLSVCASLSGIEETSNPISSADKPLSTDNRQADAFPVVFVYDNRIYRVGLSKKQTADGQRPRWWKSVDCEEAVSIMNAIREFPEAKFRLSDIKKSSGAVEYRVDVVLTALKEIGAIEPIGRQGYNAIKNGTPSEWFDKIKELPERSDLLSKW